MTVKITYFGSESEINKAITILKQHPNLENMKEPDARLLIQELIDEHRIKASILVNNNTIWSKDRVLSNLEQIMKRGTLYNQEDQTKPPILSHYFYQFLTQVCGSITHVDLYGWIHVYPTIEHFRRFFKKNELGKRVLDCIPERQTDARVIVQEIERILYPFETYMRTREEPTKLKRK